MPSTSYFGISNPQIATNTYNIANFSTNYPTGKTKYVSLSNKAPTNAYYDGPLGELNNAFWEDGNMGVNSPVRPVSYYQTYNINNFHAPNYDYTKLAGFYISVFGTALEGEISITNPVQVLYLAPQAFGNTVYLPQQFIPMIGAYGLVPSFTVNTSNGFLQFLITGCLQYII